MFDKAIKDYHPSWSLDTIKSEKKPLLIVATGPMNQCVSVATFLGRAVEEKFHLMPLAISIIPCIPLVSSKLKDMVHPDVGPTQLTEGVSQGYFLVDLSLNQNFDLGPEFFSHHERGDSENDEGTFNFRIWVIIPSIQTNIN